MPIPFVSIIFNSVIDEYNSNSYNPAEIPNKHIFEINEHQKYRLLSENRKKIRGKFDDTLNFVWENGRKSVKRGGRSSNKERNILPTKIRGNLEYQINEKLFRNKKFSKESNSCLERKYDDHPMIINQMQDPKVQSQIDTSP